MRVLIVARTKMGARRCIGAIAERGNRSLRLFEADGASPQESSALHIGSLWEMRLAPKGTLTLPHTEDHRILSMTGIDGETQLGDIWQKTGISLWKGPPQGLFNGLLQYKASGSAYISGEGGVPDFSTEFWLPGAELELEGDGRHYRYKGGVRMAYVGEPEAVASIPSHTLVRVSLARWWSDAPEKEERCFLQLSGWYQ